MKLSQISSAAALAVCCAAGVVCVVELAFASKEIDGGAWAVRGASLLLGLGVGAGLCTVLLRGWKHSQRIAERYLADLTRLDPREMRGDEAERFGQLPSGHPLTGVTAGLRDAMLAHYESFRDIEHAKTLLEVRCRRAVAEAEQARAIFAGLSDPILVVDDYDELTLANPQAEELLQIEPRDAATRAMGRLVKCEKLVNLLAQTTRRKSSGMRTEDIEIIDRDGQPRFFRASATRLSSSGESSAAGAVAVLRDIGEQKAMQKRNAEFVSAVSHEMKTPLAGIKAYVELLADGEADDEATREEFLDVINGQADRMQRLIDNLLNLARIEAGVVKVQKQPRALNEILEEAMRVVRPSAEAKKITLTAELSSMYLGVLADRDMLLQSAINLLSNAIKYTAEGGSVWLRSRMTDGEIRFEVQDTGVGLSEEDAKRVFEKFYRVKKSKEMAAGTGLGLPLAKHIIEDVHGGRIVVESKLGEGSTFIAILPAAGQTV